MNHQFSQSGYEELIIDGVICWRVDGDPAGVYKAYTAEQLSSLVCDLRAFIKPLRSLSQ